MGKFVKVSSLESSNNNSSVRTSGKWVKIGKLSVKPENQQIVLETVAEKARKKDIEENEKWAKVNVLDLVREKKNEQQEALRNIPVPERWNADPKTFTKTKTKATAQKETAEKLYGTIPSAYYNETYAKAPEDIRKILLNPSNDPVEFVEQNTTVFSFQNKSGIKSPVKFENPDDYETNLKTTLDYFTNPESEGYIEGFKESYDYYKEKQKVDSDWEKAKKAHDDMFDTYDLSFAGTYTSGSITEDVFDFVQGRGPSEYDEVMENYKNARDARHLFYGTKPQTESEIYEYIRSYAGHAIMTGVASVNKGATATLDFTIGNILKWCGWDDNPVTQFNDWVGENLEAYSETQYKKGLILGDKHNLVGTILSGMMQAAPSAFAAMGTAGTSVGIQSATAVSGTTSSVVANSVKGMAKNPLYWQSFTSTLGTDYEQAKANGASELEATLYATLTSTLNAAVEMGFGTESAGFQSLPDALKDALNTNNKHKVWLWVKSSLEEGREEGIQKVISDVNALMYGHNELENKSLLEYGGEVLNEMAMGTMVAGFMTGGQLTVDNAINAKTNEEYRSLGETLKNFKPEEINDIVDYATKSFNTRIRAVALNYKNGKNTNSIALGELYSYTLKNIQEAINSPKTIIEAAQEFEEIINTSNSQTIKNIANSQFISRLIEVGIDEESAAVMAKAYDSSASASDEAVDTAGSVESDVLSGAGVPSPADTSGEVFRTPETKEIYTKNPGLLDDGLNPHQRYIQNISDKFGIRLLWDKTGKVKTGKYNSETKTIILNPNMGTAEAYMFVFKHEFTHWLADRKGFQNVKNYLLNKSGEFYKYALEQCEANGIEHGDGREDVISAYCNYLFDTYKNSDELSAYEKSIFTLESAQEEAVANFVASKLFDGIKTEEGYNSLMSLKNENKGIIQTFIDFIKHLKNKFFGDKRTRTLGEDLDYIEERLQQILLSKEKTTTEAVAEKHYVEYENANLNSEILGLTNKVESGEFNKKDKIEVGIIDKEQSNIIEKITGISTEGYKVLLEARQIEHIIKEHGKNGRSDRSLANNDDIAKLQFVIAGNENIVEAGSTTAYVSNVDGKNKPAKTVLYEKEIGDKSYYVVEAVPDTSKKCVYIVSAFIGKKGYKKEILQSTNAKSPGATPKSEVANISNNRIPQNESTVNNNIYTESEIDTYSNKNYIPADSFGLLLEDFENGKITKEEFKEKATEIDKKREKALETKYRNKYRTERSKFKPYRGSIADLQRIGKKLKDSIGSNYDSELLVNELGALMSMADRTNVNHEELSRASRYLAERIVEYQVPVITEESKEMLGVIKATPFSLNKGQVAEIERIYGTLGKFKKEYRGKISIIDDAPTLDSVWGELSSAYPWEFENDVSDAQLPISLVEKVESLENTFEEFEDSTDTVIRVYNDIMSEVIHSRRAAYEEDRKTQGARALAQTREEYKIEREAADKRHGSIYSIQRSVRKLDRMARKATNSNHLPENLRVTIHQVVNTFAKASKGIFEGKELTQIRLFYKECLENSEIGKYMNDELVGEIQLLENILDGKSILDLSQNELDSVNDIIDYFNFFVTMENQEFIEKRETELEERGNKAIGEIEESKGFLANHDEKKAQKLLDTVGINNREAFYVFKQLGGEFEKLYWRLVEGGNRFSTYCEKFSCFAENVKDKHNYESWKDNIITVNLKGKEIKLTVEEALSVYAMAQRERSNRYEHQKHLIKGGLVFKVEELRKRLKKEIKSPSKRREFLKELKKGATKVDDSDINRIVSQIPEKALGYANDMIAYISTECAKQGNAVSMELYNYKKYREGFYFPFQVAEAYLETQEVKKTREEKLKAPGFTHSLQIDAIKPLAVRGFSTVVAEHVEKMANHNAAASAMTDLINLLNFTTGDGKTIKALIEDKYGSSVLDYIADFVDDMNGGYVKDSRVQGIAKFANNTKKARVLGNLSVIVQQPHAINRATAEIDYKYLLAAPKYKATWNEIKHYAPVAIIKEKGRYDIGLGVKNQDWLLAEKPENFVDKVNDVAGKGPGSADKVAWWYLYKAVKAEIANTTELQVDSEEFNKAVGKRFTEIVYKTQVFDSTLTKSGNMRSKDSIMQAATVYMAEPTKQINVILDAVNDVKNGVPGAKKKLGRVARAFIIEAAFNAASVALIRGVLRDDDEDKSAVEKYLSSFVDVFLHDNLNLLSKIPFIKDVVSLTEGWSVERLEFEGIADVIKEFQNFSASLENRNFETIGSSLWNFGLKVSTFFGLPFESVERDIKGVVNMFGENDNPTNATGIQMALAEIFGTVENDNDRYRKLYEAAESGDQEEFESIYKYLRDEKGKSDSAIQKGLLAISKESKNVKKEVKKEIQQLQSSGTYKNLSDEHKEGAQKDIEKYIAMEEKVEKTDNAKKQYIELFKLKEKYGANHKKYKEAYDKLLKAGKTEKQIKDGLLVGEILYVESLGVDVNQYILFKYAMKKDYADTDKSGGVSKKEKYAAIGKLDVDKKAKEKLKGLI